MNHIKSLVNSITPYDIYAFDCEYSSFFLQWIRPHVFLEIGWLSTLKT